MAPPPNTPSDKPLTLHARYQAPPPPPSGTTTNAADGSTATTVTTSSTDTDPNTAVAAAAAAAPQHQVFTHPLPSSLSLNRGTDSPTNRSAYLSDLRAAVATMQDEINVFLTARMGEDSRRLAAPGSGSGGGGREAKEKKEEENYGEEVVDEG